METGKQRPANDFHSAMEAVIKAIREKKFGQAAILASPAYNLTPNLSEQARAARDLSAAYRHQGDYDESEKWTTEAVEQHEALAKEGENRKIDQYDINFTARTGFAEVLAGDTKKSLALGARAAWLAFLSESPKIDRI